LRFPADCPRLAFEGGSGSEAAEVNYGFAFYGSECVRTVADGARCGWGGRLHIGKVDFALEEHAKKFGVIIYDAEILKSQAVATYRLWMDFEQIQQDALLLKSPPIADLEMHSLELKRIDPVIRLPASSRGRELWEKIEALEPGKDHFSEYEKRCTEALQYLFESDLTAWVHQNETDTLHRFDLIARVSSQNDFWQCMRDRFRAQYIVFEFKNHTKKITQVEIYSTEKYLYPNALRGVAIIFSREGPDDHAMMAAKGALRESGKLILNCSNADLRSMLLGKDDGEEPSNLLLSILDEMLMSIER